MKLFRDLVILAALLSGSSTAASTVPDTDVRGVVEGVIAHVESEYVIAERRAAIGARLRASLRSGRYANLDPGSFSRRVTEDMRVASPDKHLLLTHDPAAHAGLVAAGGASGSRAERADPHEAQQARLRNDGYEDMRILEGNVRYIRITGFFWRPDVTGHTIDAAARFMKEGDAVVLDLRGNGGGDSSAVEYLISYFISQDHRLGTFQSPLTGKIGRVPVLQHLPAGRIQGKPVFVLVDGRTASAAESVAYHLQQTGLARVVGQATSGAANTATLYAIKPSFVLSVSTGRPVHPLTGANWEGIGVKPDVAISSERALDSAHALALQSLISARNADRLPQLEWALVDVRARLQPYVPTPEELAVFTGAYGKQDVFIQSGELYLRPAGRRPLRLRPLAKDLFSLGDDPTARVGFVRDGMRVVALEARYNDGDVVRVERKPGS